MNCARGTLSRGSDDLAYEILSVVSEIPSGRVATYGQLARLIGREKNSRQVGLYSPQPSVTETTLAIGWLTTPDAPHRAGQNRQSFCGTRAWS